MDALKTNNLIDKQSPIPVYHQISTNLRNRITAQEWKKDDKLPSEFELSDLYGVNRITIRKALDELERDGLIERLRGIGAFVREIPQPIIHDFSLPSTLCAKLGQRGISLDAQILELTALAPVQNYNTILQLPASQTLIFIRRLFLQKNYPVAVNNSWISQALLPDILEQGLIENHLSRTLSERYRLVPVRIANTIEAAHANVVDIRLLNILYDTPTMVVSSVSYLPSGTPLEYSKTVWRGDHVKFHFDMND